MKAKASAKPFLVIAFGAAVAVLGVNSMPEAASPVQDRPAATNEVAKVDFDFTRMNPTMRMAYTYRLGANPKEFAGKTLRIAGTFLARVDEDDGKRYFGCLLGEPGGCSCCSPGGVLEFMPKDSYVWPTNFPPEESTITVTGMLKLFEEGDNALRQATYTIPRIIDAEIVAW